MRTETGHLSGRELPAVHLDEVLATAALLDRNDRKYVLTLEDLDGLVRAIPDDWRVLTIDGRSQHRYRSVYLDDPRLGCFLATARQRPHRSKVRLRSYLDSRLHYLEVKVRDATGRTTKHRRRTSAGTEMTQLERSFVRPLVTDGMNVDDLHPTLTTTYRRSTVLPPGGTARLTVDHDLRAADSDGRALVTRGLVIVETKSSGPPTVADRLLWRHGHRPVAISKYATCLAALHPGLPRNRWHRLLRQEFTAAAASHCEARCDCGDQQGGSRFDCVQPGSVAA